MDPAVITAIVELLGKGALLLLEYLKVLAWPLVVLLLAFAFKGTIVDVLSRLRKASGFGATFELTARFEHDARELNEKPVPELDGDEAGGDRGSASGDIGEPAPLDAAQSHGGQTGAHATAPAAPPGRGRIYSVRLSGDAAPTARDEAHNYWIMMRAWAALEDSAVRVGGRLQLSPGPARNLGYLGGQLLERRLISAEAFELGARLQDLRNRMVHELDRFVFTDWLADDFAETAGKLVKIYEDVLARLNKGGAGDNA